MWGRLGYRSVRTPYSWARRYFSFGRISRSDVRNPSHSPTSPKTSSEALILDRRNIAVIAHVDHGKTTLVDCLLKQSLVKLGELQERAMDHNPLERERGITILAKCTSVLYRQPTAEHLTRINIVDTPGHSDFGGEVERIMSMVDGVVLVVDATEGPMTQTKFVLDKALKQGLKPFVVINKVDRPTARVGEVENEIFGVFAQLEANDDQLEYPTLYASGIQGWAVQNLEDPKKDMTPLFDLIMSYVPPPNCDINKPFSMLITQIESNVFFGKMLLGRIASGRVRIGDTITAVDADGKVQVTTKVMKIMYRNGLEQVIVDEAVAGDIVSIAGFAQASVNSTLCDPGHLKAIPSIPIDPPTLSMIIHPNDSPLAGREGSRMNGGAIRERLLKEAENNVSLQVSEVDNDKDAMNIRGRGELQLGILIETMRREGFELAFSAPQVVFQTSKEGEKLEPMEEVVLDVPTEMSSNLISKLYNRQGDMIECTTQKDRTRLVFHVTTRGLIGFRTEFVNETHGEGVMNQRVLKYVPHQGEIDRISRGALVATEQGKATAYAIAGIEPRGKLFIQPGEEVYEGMVIGEHNKDSELQVNCVRAKKLTNVRAATKDDNIKLVPASVMSLESLITYVHDDELVEVTPKAFRLRKKVLDNAERVRSVKRDKK